MDWQIANLNWYLVHTRWASIRSVFTAQHTGWNGKSSISIKYLFSLTIIVKSLPRNIENSGDSGMKSSFCRTSFRISEIKCSLGSIALLSVPIFENSPSPICGQKRSCCCSSPPLTHPKRSNQWPPLNAASPENVSLHLCLRTTFSPFYHSSLCSSQALAPKTVPQIFLRIKHETAINLVTP